MQTQRFEVPKYVKPSLQAPLKIQTNRKSNAHTDAADKGVAFVHGDAHLSRLNAVCTSTLVHSARTSPSYTSLLIVKILSSTFS